MGAIYKIESVIHPERVYIGSAVNLSRRWSMHLSALRKDKHHSGKLQNHFNKYGEVDLLFSVLLECEKESLLINEQSFIYLYKPYFNICPTAGSSLGVIRSDEWRAKISTAMLGRKNPFYGKHHSTEAREKMSAASKGKPKSKEHRAKLSAAKSGKNHPMYGKHLPNETKAKIGFVNSNPSAETREKLREASIRAWKLKKEINKQSV